ncbi:hypothetical protein [Pseudanabaena sp. 'Roaring Creek']|nr:hypothetical protein [Pseudanabaena sp. 'Roaring Creek']
MIWAVLIRDREYGELAIADLIACDMYVKLMRSRSQQVLLTA